MRAPQSSIVISQDHLIELSSGHIRVNPSIKVVTPTTCIELPKIILGQILEISYDVEGNSLQVIDNKMEVIQGKNLGTLNITRESLKV